MKRVLIAAAVSSMAGCGTCRNLLPSDIHDDPPLKVYGGVRTAADSLYASPHGAGVGMPFVWPFVAADVAGSAVADTFTLPLTGLVEAGRLARQVYAHYFPPPPKPAAAVAATPALVPDAPAVP